MNCKWKSCTNCVLRDDFCVRHLKQTCMICLEKVPSTNSARSKRLKCGHSYHFRCIIKWFETSDECPACRQTQSNDDLIIFKNNIEESLRKKYNDTIKSYEREIRILRQTQ